jgi:hypothetical protein
MPDCRAGVGMFSDRFAVLAEIGDDENFRPTFLHLLIENVYLQLSPVPCELGVLVVVDCLAGKHQNLKIQQCTVQGLDRVFVKGFGQVDAAYTCAKRCTL